MKMDPYSTPLVNEKEMLTIAKRRLKHCLVCHDPRIVAVGFFQPTDPELLWRREDLRPHATRLRFFALCKRCAKQYEHRGREFIERFLVMAPTGEQGS